MKRPIILLFSLAFLLPISIIQAQASAAGYVDLGKTQISDGIYSQISNIGFFEKPQWGVGGGYQLGLVQPQDVIFNSWYVSSYGKLSIGSVPLVLGGEYLWTAISPDLRETNRIVFARTTLQHWQFGLGTGTRIYRLSKSAAKDAYLFDPENRITERWNIIYHAMYVLKPHENIWNMSVSITNYDHFIIQQEINPMYNLRLDYKINSPLSAFSELWYKSAGLMVIRVTYFGVFLRMGLIWEM